MGVYTWRKGCCPASFLSRLDPSAPREEAAAEFLVWSYFRFCFVLMHTLPSQIPQLWLALHSSYLVRSWLNPLDSVTSSKLKYLRRAGLELKVGEW